MTTEDPYADKRVWILGAGFSRPLGAPLFNELFTDATGMLVKTAFAPEEYPRLHMLFDLVRNVYWRGVGDPTTSARPKNIPAWRDPEQFLEVISGWADRSVPVRLDYVSPLPTREADSYDWKAILQASLLRLAAEVSHCLCDDDVLQSERGLCYKSWVERLEPGRDVVITFNYDTLAERACEEFGGGSDRVIIANPHNGEERDFGDVVPILKMHGSVDWFLNDKTIERLPQNALLERASSVSEIGMAIPGRGKLGFSSQHSWLWNSAEQFIERASHLRFVGYRMPETDGLSLNRICKSIRRRVSRAGHPAHFPTIEIVLGPIATPERERLAGIMRMLLGEAGHEDLSDSRVRVMNMWAQDFFQGGERRGVVKGLAEALIKT